MLVYKNANANQEIIKICLGQIYNFKLVYFAISAISWHTQGHPHVELKIWPRSLNLSIVYHLCLIVMHFHSELFSHSASYSKFHWLCSRSMLRLPSLSSLFSKNSCHSASQTKGLFTCPILQPGVICTRIIVLKS